jgi:hypothetical protein
MLPYVLDAKTHYEITPRGAHCTIELPLRINETTGLPNVMAAQ